MRSMVERTSPSASLAGALNNARRRWRMRHVAAGAVVVIAALGVTVWGAAAVMEQLRFTPSSVVLGRVILGLVAAIVGVRWILYPLVRRITDDRLALYLEEKVPSLDGAVLSAVEVQQQPVGSEARSPLLERGLITDAVRRLERAEEIPALERPATVRSTGVAAALVAVVAALIAFGPSYIRQGTRLMLTPWSDPATAPVYAISIEPGDATVARGSDVQVNATLHGFTSELVELVMRRGSNGEWQRIPMGPSADSGGVTARLFDVAEDAEYFVEASGVRSTVAKLLVKDLPAVDSVSVELRFPGYTGMAPEVVTNGGDIAALVGTRATVQVRVSRPVQSGAIVFDNGARIPLTVAGGTTLSTAMIIQKDGFYRVELVADDGTTVPGPLEYVIDALDDAAPDVTITKPGRDMRPTSVDEVLIEAQASDDYGVGRMELVYRVNGGAEQVVPLTQGGSGRSRDLTAGHTIFLEEMSLQPGDVVAYYARAWDNGAKKQQAASDIYFLTVRPFDRTFRQNQQGAPPGGGGGQQENNPGAIVEQQREIISATYKAQRDSARTNARTLSEDVATIQLSQGKLREQVKQMIERLRRPGVQQADSGFRAILQFMTEAEKEMEAAEKELAKPELGSALSPEQRALQKAERAEAVFRDVQVSMQQGAQGGGGGGNANANDLADMLELENDKMRNQYEGVQRSEQQQAEAQVDETLERLKRLAARQQQENEKLRQRAQQMQGGAGGGGGSQRQLADETEQLARQLERLSREQRNPEMGETARRLQEAANQMRRSAASNGSAGSGAGGAASEELERARRLLEEAQRTSATNGAGEAAQRAERLAAQQREVAKEVEQLGQSGTRGEQEQRLDERKAQMAAEAAALERDLERMARDNRAQQSGTARAMREAAEGMRRTRVEDRIQYSRQSMRSPSREFANNVERQIQGDLDSLASRTQRLAGAAVAGSDSAQRASRTLSQARDLVRGLASIDERMRERQQQGGAGRESGQGQAGQQNQRGQQGQQGQQGQGQQGQSQGQQGEGQQGQQGQGQAQGAQGQRGQGQAQGQQGQGQGQGQGEQGQQGQGQGQGQSGQQQGGQGGRRGLNDQPGGMSGERTPGGQIGGNGQGGPGRFSAEDVRQFSRELRSQREVAEELRRNLSGTGISTADLDRLIARLREMESTRTFDDPEELERLRGSVIEGMKEFEFGLRRQLGAADRNGPVLGGSDDVPQAYRDMVNEYFRSLSRRPRK